MAAEPHDPRCKELAHPDLVNFVLSVLILVGILLSYLPQHWRIIARRSSDGLSPYFILLGTTSGTCAIANILVLPESRTDIGCCAVNSAFSCAAGLLGIAQIGVQWSCFFLISLLFLIFIPRPHVQRRSHHATPLLADDSAWRDAVIVVSASIIHFVITFIISIIMLARFRQHLGTWANALGAFCAVLASIQYLPQLWTTWRRQHIGSLSIPMMCIQTPGAFVFAASLAIRLGSKGWSAWVVYVVTGSLQGVLLVMAIIFERRDRRMAKHAARGLYPDLSDDDDVSDAGGAGHSDAETDPLIENDRLAERQRQRQQLERPAPGPLHPSKLRPDPVSSSSDSPPDDLLIDRAALAEQENQGRSTLADVASSLAAPFRRQSTRWYDARSRRDSQQTTTTTTEQANSAPSPAAGNGTAAASLRSSQTARRSAANGSSEPRSTADF